MIGSKQVMPKRFRYPIFFVGLVVLILGTVLENAAKAPVSAFEATAIVGFALLVLSVIVR